MRVNKKGRTDKNILVAFILNLAFSIIEFVGGSFTRSVAIISDSIHDFGDALSIGISYFLERKSREKPNEKYTYGYIRFSVLGSTITTAILITGSILVIYNAILRIINPVEINYEGMIIFAVFGIIINFIAAFFTKEGDSLNQRSVNLHMLEDVLGWVVVLIGAIIMKFVNITYIDPIMSIGVAIFILINAIKNLGAILSVFLEKTPKGINVSELKEHLKEIEEVIDVHHVHVWSMDGFSNFATLHIVTRQNNKDIKDKIREELEEHGINHVTIEIEAENEGCSDENCNAHCIDVNHLHHHHHHHH